MVGGFVGEQPSYAAPSSAAWCRARMSDGIVNLFALPVPSCEEGRLECRGAAGRLRAVHTDNPGRRRELGPMAVPAMTVAAFALLEMGMGVAGWYRPDGRSGAGAPGARAPCLRASGWSCPHPRHVPTVCARRSNQSRAHDALTSMAARGHGSGYASPERGLALAYRRTVRRIRPPGRPSRS